jgi:hypothetical protein
MDITDKPCPICGGDARIQGVKLSLVVSDDSDYVMVRGETCRPFGYFLTVSAYRSLAGPSAACSKTVCERLCLRIQEDPKFGSPERPITAADCVTAEKVPY